MLETLCAVIARQNPQEFPSVIQNIRGKRRIYFSVHENQLTKACKVPGTDIYVETNLSANNTKSLCDALSSYFGYGPVLVIEFFG